MLAVPSVDAKWPLILILSAFVLLGVFYSLATPPLEASDEYHHYPYVHYVQTQHALPVMDAQDPGPWRQEAGQPPLYYLLMAGLTAWVDTSDFEDVHWINPHAFIGMPHQVGNKNLVIHRPQREAFPWRGTILAVHVIRLGSVVLGAVTVWLVWRVAGQLCPRSNWMPLLAAALTAFNPMFVFVSAAVNNDVLAALLGSLGVLLLLRILDHRSQISNPRVLAFLYVALGVVLGLGALTKLSLIAMLPLAGFVVAYRVWRGYRGSMWPRCVQAFILQCALFLLPTLAIAGWWYVRNWQLYGDPTGVNVFMDILGYRTQPLTLKDLWQEFGTFRRTYWGLFGGVNVPAPEPVYVFYDLLSLVGLMGFGVLGWRRRKTMCRDNAAAWLIPLLWVGILFIALLRWVMMYYSFQGRLMFPGIAALSIVLALGLGAWFPHRWRGPLVWGIGGILLALAACVPLFSILPAYAYPQSLTLADIPSEDRVEPVTIGDVARVVGWRVEPQTVYPGHLSTSVEFVVYWEAVAPADDGAALISFAKLMGRGSQLVGAVNRYPANGMVPLSLWQPGQVWREVYRVPIDGTVAQDLAPSQLTIEVGFYDPAAKRDVGSVRVGQAKLAPPAEVAPLPNSLPVALTDGIALQGYDLSSSSPAPGETITLTLQWRATGTPSTDYQVFVHLLGDVAQPLAQGDGPPLMGGYPTHLWAPGEVVNDPHPVPLPPDLEPGRYHLFVGLYHLQTGVRLTRLDGAGDSIEIPAPVEVR